MPDPILASNIPEEASPTRPLAVVVNDPDGTPAARLVDLDGQYQPLGSGDTVNDAIVAGLVNDIDSATNVAIGNRHARSTVLDARDMPDGVLAGVTSGVFVGVGTNGVSGAVDALISGGALVVKTLDAGGVNSNIYVNAETPDGQTCQYMRGIIEWPVGSNCDVTFGFTQNNWFVGPALTAAQHMTLDPWVGGVASGTIAAGGYGTGVNVASRMAVTGANFAGTTTDIEVWLNKTTGRCVVHRDGRKIIEYTDIDGIAHMSKYGFIEISGGGATGAISPRILYWEMGSDFNPPATLGMGAQGNVITTYTLTSSMTDIGQPIALNTVYPASGRLAVWCSLWLTQDAGTTEMRMSDGTTFSPQYKVAVGAYDNRYTYMGQIAGTPHKAVRLTMQGMHFGGGTATIAALGDRGIAYTIAIPLESYAPAVES